MVSIKGDPWRRSFELYLGEQIRTVSSSPELKEALEYSLFPGGKRIRPLFIEAIYCDFGGVHSNLLLPAAAALEIVHCSSLIHDDLPALDNDDLRRGKPTVHRKYGEALAILAGDFMVPWAFSLLSQYRSEQQAALMAGLAKAYMAVCDGQVIDIRKEGVNTRELHEKKTAALFECAAVFGAVIADAPADQIKKSAAFGKSLGLLFQAVDDVLDGDSNEEGGRGRLRECVLELEATLASLTIDRDAAHSRGVIRKTIEQLKSDTGIDAAGILARF